MKATAIDPGWTTGLAFYSSHAGTLTGSRSVKGERLERCLREPWARQQDLFVVERIPESGDSTTYALYLDTLRQLRRVKRATVVTPSPGEWKPWAKAHPLPVLWADRVKDQHTRDASSMLYWWLMTHEA